MSCSRTQAARSGLLREFEPNRLWQCRATRLASARSAPSHLAIRSPPTRGAGAAVPLTARIERCGVDTWPRRRTRDAGLVHVSRPRRGRGRASACGGLAQGAPGPSVKSSADFVVALLQRGMSPDQRGLVHGLRSRGHAQVATWNIAAVNNNPFEYWITHDDAQYNELMKRVQVWPVATETGVLKIRGALWQ